jgi:hypothetical protein
MNPRLLALKIHIPAFIRKAKLVELYRLTAHAFGCPPPVRKRRSYRELLEDYAEFTRSQAESCLQGGTGLEEVKRKLFEGAYRMGRDIRHSFRLRNPADILEMSRILYRIMGIDFSGTGTGDVTIRRCFFSDYYTPHVCRVISSLDEGFAAGLSKGGSLSFSQRITEGKESCKARFVFPEKRT